MQITTALPITSPLTRAYNLSLLSALLMAGVSLAGLLWPDTLYPDAALRRAFISNDLVNLCLGLPILLAALGLTRRGSLLGLLYWPGALFYISYNYIAYASAMPAGLLTVIYLALVLLSVYTIAHLLRHMHAPDIEQRLAGALPLRFAGAVLIGLGSLFVLRAAGQLAGALSGQLTLSAPEIGTSIADLLTTPGYIIGGILLWRRHRWGYLIGAGLLFQASMLFIGLLVFFSLQPVLAGVPFPTADFIVIFSMGLICFVPFGLFTRGIIQRA